MAVTVLYVISSGNEPDFNPDAGVENSNGTLDHGTLETVSNSLKTGFQTGALENALGVEMTDVKVSAPVPPVNDSAWSDFLETAANSTESSEELRRPTQIVAEWKKTQQQEGITFPTKFLIKFLDKSVSVCLYCFCRYYVDVLFITLLMCYLKANSKR